MFSVFTRRVVLSAARIPASVNVALRSPIASARTFTSSRLVSNAEPVKKKKLVKLTKDGMPRAKPGPKPKTSAKGKKVKATPKKSLARKVAPKKKVVVTLKSSKIIKPPPRAYSPYTLFVSEHLKGQQGNAVNRMKDLAQEWNNLNETQKEVYQQRAAAERVLRREKFDQYMAGVDHLTLLRFNKQRRKEGKNALHSPKGVRERRPSPPFFAFLAYLRASPQYSGLKILELSQEGGKQWRAMTPEEKAKFAAPTPPKSG